MNNSIPLFFQEILDKKRLEMIPFLKVLKEKGFYLAGWTALALQYGHRESIDFDFFTLNLIDTEKLFEKIRWIFKDFQIKKVFEEKNTLYVEIDWVKFSFFTYLSPLIERTIETEDIIIARDIDIACMKLWAIQNRATNKDYIDLYFILEKHSLPFLLEMFYKKFWRGIISENYLRKSLVYFDDIVEEPLRLHSDVTFDEVKKELEKKVMES